MTDHYSMRRTGTVVVTARKWRPAPTADVSIVSLRFSRARSLNGCRKAAEQRSVRAAPLIPLWAPPPATQWPIHFSSAQCVSVGSARSR